MKNSVMIKGNKYGVGLVLSPNIEFDALLEEIAIKFQQSASFFNKQTQMAISFEGRELSNDEQQAILEVIAKNSSLNIMCIVDSKTEQVFKNSIEQKLKEIDISTGKFYKGTLRSGSCLEFDGSIVIIGDVNPGAKVIAKGNIIIIGCLKGEAVAGSDGNCNVVVVALDMQPIQVRIGNVIGRAPDEGQKKKLRNKMNKKLPQAKIAFVEDENIYIEPISKNLVNEISLKY